MTTSTLLYFLSASVLLTLAPGPDNIFVLTQGVTRGRKPAIITALGMCSGISVHTTAAAFGISALFYSSMLAFNLLKYAGATYLLYLAIRTLGDRAVPCLAQADDRPTAALFKRGFFMNVLNPKVTMFFLAFLPQFVAPASGHVQLQMLVLGFIFMVQAIVIFYAIGYFSGGIGNYILTKPRIAKTFHWLTAGVFASMGIRLAMTNNG